MAGGAVKQQVAELVSKGVEPKDIAEHLGISVSYISQLSNDTYFQDMLAKLQSASSLARFKTVTKIDNNYDILEETFSTMLADNAQGICAVMMSKPATLNAFMRNLNQMKRRSTGEAQTVQQAGSAVLELPAFMVSAAIPKVQHNENNEVVQIDDRALIAMSSDQLAETSSKQTTEAIAKLTASNQPDPVVPDKLELLPS